MSHPALQVNGRTLGPSQPVFLVAEIGVNHNGDAALAAELIRGAARAGVDAVKFQRRHPEALLTNEFYNAPYEASYAYGTTYGAHRQALELCLDEWFDLRDLAHSLGLLFFASAWDIPSVADCQQLGIGLLKVASADITNAPLLDVIARTGIPVILSTGMSTIEEIADAVATIRRHHNHLALLHCVSTYPAEFEELNLRTIPWLMEKFDCPVGYSGHERGIAMTTAAVALGACIVERHFTLDRTMRGPDHAASLEPLGLSKLVRDIRALEKALGSPAVGISSREHVTRMKLAKSLVAARDMRSGHVLVAGDLVAKSPATGVSPSSVASFLGRTLRRDIAHDEHIAFADISAVPSVDT